MVEMMDGMLDNWMADPMVQQMAGKKAVEKADY